MAERGAIRMWATGAAVSLAVFLGAALTLHRSGALQLNRLDTSEYPVRGIDVSHHQGSIDWEAVARSGVAFAYIKATEGRDFIDQKFQEKWTGCAAAGVARGAYHFFAFCSSGDAQAQNFLAVIPPTPDALPPVADIEFVGNCKSYGDLDAVRDELSTFLRVVERAWGGVRSCISRRSPSGM